MADPIITAAAEADYLEAILWYVERSRRAAEGFEAEFARALADISASPHRFASYGDNRHRRFLLRRYPYQVGVSRRRGTTGYYRHRTCETEAALLARTVVAARTPT